MHTPHISDVPVFTHAQFSELTNLSQQALTEVEAQYGSGFPHYTGGIDGGLSFHNRHHSSFVMAGSEAMGQALDLTAAERAVGALAAASHDIVQLKPRGQMERESADWLTGLLQSSGSFSEEVVQVASLAVLGTEPLFDEAGLSQVAATQKYPSKSAEAIALSVACADLGELYAPIGPRMSHDLYKELGAVSPREDPSMDNLLTFQKNQLKLVEDYHYPHPMGEQVFGRYRSAVIAHTALTLERLERGDIENWSQLIAFDEAFAHRILEA